MRIAFVPLRSPPYEAHCKPRHLGIEDPSPESGGIGAHLRTRRRSEKTSQGHCRLVRSLLRCSRVLMTRIAGSGWSGRTLPRAETMKFEYMHPTLGCVLSPKPSVSESRGYAFDPTQPTSTPELGACGLKLSSNRAPPIWPSSRRFRRSRRQRSCRR